MSPVSQRDIKDSIQFSSSLLRRAGVAVVPGSAFGREGHVRISFATSMENLQKGLDRMEKALAQM
jgi:aspartate aminotransferase